MPPVPAQPPEPAVVVVEVTPPLHTVCSMVPGGQNGCGGTHSVQHRAGVCAGIGRAGFQAPGLDYIMWLNAHR